MIIEFLAATILHLGILLNVEGGCDYQIPNIETTTMYTTEYLNLRSLNDINSEIKLIIPKDSQVCVVNYDERKPWQSTIYENKFGYTKTEFLSLGIKLETKKHYSIYGYIPNFEYQDYVYDLCKQLEIENYFEYLLCQIYQESKFNQYASHGGAYGMMQIKWKYANSIADMCNVPRTSIENPYNNMYLGINYMAHLIKYFNGDINCALSAYFNGNYITGGAYPSQVIQHYSHLELLDY